MDAFEIAPHYEDVNADDYLRYHLDNEALLDFMTPKENDGFSFPTDDGDGWDL